MNKDKIEEMARNAGLKPVSREKLEDYDLYIADGFSLSPHTAHNKFGIQPLDFPNGMYVTMWWTAKGEDGGYMHHLFLDAHHDPEYSWEDKKIMRINAARDDAKKFLALRKNHVTKH
jgi:hypothetical protein